MISTVIVAFSMFSAIPMPQTEWTNKSMRYALCAFPLIGAVIGALVLLTEWRRIAAPAYKKLLSVLTFPLFMLTFIPAAVCAVFAKRGWEPTRHTVAIGIGSLAAAPRE